LGFIVLEGGAEFGGGMDAVDRRAISLAGGFDRPIRIIPAAAAPDDNHRRAGQNGIAWFQQLGAADVSAVDLIDRPSADHPDIAAELARARLIYLLGGFPHYLGQTLMDSRSGQAILDAHSLGAVIAGSSAGAMVRCDYYHDPATAQLQQGLGLVGGVCALPHHETIGKDWAPLIRKNSARIIMVGIDEQTGLINDSGPDRWRVYGKGKVTLYKNNSSRQFLARQELRLVDQG
jgi:cyanophycinase